MIPVTSVDGQTELLANMKSLRRKRKVNGDKTVEFSITPDEFNKHAYGLIDGESRFIFKNEEYVIKVVSEHNFGRKTIKKVEAIHVFFHDMINKQQHNIHNGSMTFEAAMNFIFAGTGYTFIIQGSFGAQRFENFGRENRLALFKTAIERYKAEFRVDGSTVFLMKEIGVKTDFQYRYGLNVKTIDKEINTRNLAGRIKGYGGEPNSNGVYPIELEYVSPHAAVIGDYEADPVVDERITTEAGMLERLKNELIDEPQLSIVITQADLRASGYNYGNVNEGDYGYVIYEPMDDLMLQARIVEVVEEFNAKLEPIKTNVTLSNLRGKSVDMMTRFSQTSKQLQRILSGQDQVPFSALEITVRRATEMLLGSATELEYTENGIVARSKINPDHLVLVSSAGVGVSVDNGQTFRQAITAEGIVADLIVVGTMLFDRIKGGTLTLGGHENGNGIMQILNSNGEVIADFDADRGGYADLYVANLTSPTVVSYGASDITLYVSDRIIGSGNEPNDNNNGLSWANPLATINEALNRLTMRYDGFARIVCNHGGKIYGNIDLQGFIGTGTIEIDGQSKNSTTLVGNILAAGNLVNLYFKNFTLNGRSGSFAVISTRQNSLARFSNLNIQGNNSGRGIEALQSGYAEVLNCDFQGVETGMVAKFGTTIYNRDSTGKASLRGLYAYGGFIVGTGTAPEGAVANEVEHEGGRVFATFTYPVTTPPAPPPAPETTTEWSTTGTYKGDSWRPQFGGQWLTVGNNEDAVVQGYHSGFGAYKGLWLFGSGPSNAVSGKTIKSMRLFVKRKKQGGSSGAVTCYFRPHTYTSRPAGEPSYQSPSTQASFKWDEGKWITIPSSFYSGFQNGTYKGIGIYINSTSTANYAKFFVDAKLEITYE